MLLALDASSLVHAKGLRDPEATLTGIRLVHNLVAFGGRFVTTKGVYGELVGMSLRITLSEWEAGGHLDVQNVKSLEARRFDNTIRKRVARPGRIDRALVCLAHQLNAVVLTHDNGLALYARAAGLLTIDLVDLGVLSHAMTSLPLESLDTLFHAMNLPGAFRPGDWKGSFEATYLSRTHMDSLVGELRSRLMAGESAD